MHFSIQPWKLNGNFSTVYAIIAVVYMHACHTAILYVLTCVVC